MMRAFAVGLLMAIAAPSSAPPAIGVGAPGAELAAPAAVVRIAPAVQGKKGRFRRVLAAIRRFFRRPASNATTSSSPASASASSRGRTHSARDSASGSRIESVGVSGSERAAAARTLQRRHAESSAASSDSFRSRDYSTRSFGSPLADGRPPGDFLSPKRVLTESGNYEPTSAALDNGAFQSSVWGGAARRSQRGSGIYEHWSTPIDGPSDPPAVGGAVGIQLGGLNGGPAVKYPHGKNAVFQAFDPAGPADPDGTPAKQKYGGNKGQVFQVLPPPPAPPSPPVPPLPSTPAPKPKYPNGKGAVFQALPPSSQAPGAGQIAATPAAQGGAKRRVVYSALPEVIDPTPGAGLTIQVLRK